MSEQHNQGLGAEREVADLPAEILASDGSAETENNVENAGEAQAGEEASKTAARATGGLAKLVEERTEQRERDEDREETAEEDVQEEQVAAAAAGGAEAPVDIVEVVEGLDGLSESFARAAQPAGEDASALGDGGTPSALLLGLGALGLVGAAIVIAADDGDDDDVSLPDPPPPPPANMGPVVADDVAAVTAGETVMGDVSANDSDPDGDPLNYAVAEAVDGLTLNADGTFTFDATGDAFVPLAEGETEDVVATVNVDDGQGNSATSTLTVTVTGINDLPVFTSATTFSVDENLPAGTEVFTITAEDPDNGDVVSYSLTGDDADAFAVDPMTGVVTLVAPLDFEAQDTLSITANASDLFGGVATQDITVTVGDVDDTVSLDVDSDGTIATAEPFSAADGDIAFTDSAAIESNAEITGFGVGDTIQVDEDTSNYSFTSTDDGSSATLDDLVISINNNGIVSQITLQDVIPDGTLVFDEASAETAVGADFFTDGPPPPPPAPTPPPPPPGTGGAVDGDVDDDAMPSTPVVFDAGGDALIFTDNVATASNFVIQNAGADDFVQILGGDPSSYSYTSSGTDLIVSFNNNGDVNQIVVEDAVLEGALIFDEASAEAALGNNFNNGMPIDFFQAG